MTQHTLHLLLWVSLMVVGTLPGTTNVTTLICGLRANPTSAVHHVLGHAGNAGNECADSTTSLGLRGFVSEDNVPWPDRRFVAQRLLNVFHCLYRVAEVLHSVVVELQLE